MNIGGDFDERLVILARRFIPKSIATSGAHKTDTKKPNTRETSVQGEQINQTQHRGETEALVQELNMVMV